MLEQKIKNLINDIEKTEKNKREIQKDIRLLEEDIRLLEDKIKIINQENKQKIENLLNESKISNELLTTIKDLENKVFHTLKNCLNKQKRITLNDIHYEKNYLLLTKNDVKIRRPDASYNRNIEIDLKNLSINNYYIIYNYYYDTRFTFSIEELLKYDFFDKELFEKFIDFHKRYIEIITAENNIMFFISGTIDFDLRTKTLTLEHYETIKENNINDFIKYIENVAVINEKVEKLVKDMNEANLPKDILKQLTK